MLNKAILISIPFICAACGTFQLATDIHAPLGKTAEQQQSDILMCKDQAKMAASTAGKQTQAFLLGMTIVGAPAAVEMDKKTQRETFANCMRAKGYTLNVADDGYKTAVPVAQPQPQLSQGTKSDNHINDSNQTSDNTANNTNTISNNAARLEELKKLKDEGVIDQTDYDKKKKEILDSM